MYLYEVFQTWESLRHASMLGKNEITQAQLIAQKIQLAEAGIMQSLQGESDQTILAQKRENMQDILTREVYILAQRAQEIQEAIRRGIGVILGIHESKRAFLRTESSELIDVPSDTEGNYILRAPIPSRFQTIPPLPSGLVPIIDDISRQHVNQWPLYVDMRYMGRKTECFPSMTMSQIMNHLQQNWQYPYFLKTLSKNVSMEIRSEEDLERFQIHMKRDEENCDSTGYIISELMEINADARGKREFRAYIVRGLVANISRNIVDTGAEDVSGEESVIPESIGVFCRDFASHHPALQTYVLDAADCHDGLARLVELNDFCYSGRFEKNDFVTIVDRFDILEGGKTDSFLSLEKGR